MPGLVVKGKLQCTVRYKKPKITIGEFNITLNGTYLTF